jgi:hypothetical protein
MRLGDANNETQVTTVSASSSFPHLPLDSQLSIAGSVHAIVDSPNQVMENREVDEADVRMQDEDSFVSGHGIDSTTSSFIEGSYLACLDSQQSDVSDIAYEARLKAFRTILGNADGISLISTTDNHSKPELDLGG